MLDRKSNTTIKLLIKMVNKNFDNVLLLSSSFFSFFNITYDKHVKRIISNIIFGTGLFFSILIYFYKFFPQIYQTLILVKEKEK